MESRDQAAVPPSGKEARIEALRAEAESRSRATATPVAPTELPAPGSEHGYYGQPILKEPVWTWEIPLYFFLGGTAGAAAAIAAIARIAGADPALERTALLVAALFALASPPLLVSDLGRPRRFLAMLRVWKLRSPMSVGAWTLALFTPAVGLALAARWFATSPLLSAAGTIAEIAAALLGLVLLTYTGVLLAATAIPVWTAHRTLLPPHFTASALGSAAAVLELCGFLVPATQAMGIAATAFETGIGMVIEGRRRRIDEPVRHGATGRTIRIGGVLSGPVSLALRLAGERWPPARLAAAVCFIAGAIVTRYAWVSAGRASARDVGALFAMQRGGTRDLSARS